MSIPKDERTPGLDSECLPRDMTLRDYFAAKAIDRMICLSSDNEGGWDPAAVAAGCYAVADAMLEYRRDDELDLDPRTPEYGVAR